jgi:REG-2-like HAD superfamily hydrolase
MIPRVLISSTSFCTKFTTCQYPRNNRLNQLFSTSSHNTIVTNNKLTPRKRIRAISCDVTGTLVSFQGKIEDHYGNAARACGVELPPEQAALLPDAFKVAYKETSTKHPCFGNSTISSKEWWRICVRKSFDLVGCTSMKDDDQERVFQRVYSAFGGHGAYAAFPDAIPFLNWCHRRGIACGVISNADERYGDSILPMLGLREAMQFLTFSKNVGYEKPHRKIFETALKEAEPWLCLEKSYALEADPLRPEEILHIGNDFQKDFVGATEAGFHAVLLDRFDETEVASEWRANGARVYKDLIDVVEFLGREQFELGSRECCAHPDNCYDI